MSNHCLLSFCFETNPVRAIDVMNGCFLFFRPGGRAVLLLLALALPWRVFGQPAPGSLDTGYAPSITIPGGGPSVSALALQSDGRAVIGGSFSSVGGSSRNNFARLNTNGTLDTTFSIGTGADASVYAVALQADGRPVLGGEFTRLNGNTRFRIGRVTTAGAYDSGLNPHDGADNFITSLLIQPDGRILVGGAFTNFDQSGYKYLVRINANGSVDTTFFTGAGPDDVVETIARQADGKVLIGGNFTSVDGFERHYLARLTSTGSVDTAFSPEIGPDFTVYAIVPLADGRILIGGAFLAYDGEPIGGVARLNADGSLDPTFKPGTGANGAVYAMARQNDGKIVIGGDFSSFDGFPRGRVARLNVDGSLDLNFNPGAGPNAAVLALAIQGDGQVLVGGLFSSISGTSRPGLARLNGNEPPPTAPVIARGPSNQVIYATQTATFTAMASGFPAPSFQWQFNGANISGATSSTLTLSNAQPAQSGAYRVIVSNSAGSTTSLAGNLTVNALPSGAGSLDVLYDAVAPNNVVYAVLPQTNGSLVLGGAFTMIGSDVRNRIARLTPAGALDTTFDPGGGFNGPVYTIARQADGKFIVGGVFTLIDGNTRNNIARLNPDGSFDVTFAPGTGADASVDAVAIQPDGKIVLVGSFFNFNGQSRNRYARLLATGALDPAFNAGTGANGFVFAVALQPDGRILIGGDFTSVNGVSRPKLARLNSDGTVDTSFNPTEVPSSAVYSIVVQPDGRIVAGGKFTFIGNNPKAGVVRYFSNGALDSSFNTGAGARGSVLAMVLQPDGRLVIGGSISMVNNVTVGNIAGLTAQGDLDAGFNAGSGANDLIQALALAPGGKIVVGGFFTQFAGLPRPRVARLNNPSVLTVLSASRSGGVNRLRVPSETGRTYFLEYRDAVNYRRLDGVTRRGRNGRRSYAHPHQFRADALLSSASAIGIGRRAAFQARSLNGMGTPGSAAHLHWNVLRPGRPRAGESQPRRREGLIPQDPLSGLRQSIHHLGTGKLGGVRLFHLPSVARADQQRLAHSGVPAAFQVDQFIAHHVGTGEIDLQFIPRIQEELREKVCGRGSVGPALPERCKSGRAGPVPQPAAAPCAHARGGHLPWGNSRDQRPIDWSQESGGSRPAEGAARQQWPPGRSPLARGGAGIPSPRSMSRRDPKKQRAPWGSEPSTRGGEQAETRRVRAPVEEPGLHLLQHVDAEQVEALLQNTAGQIAEQEAGGSFRIGGLEHRAILIETREVPGQFVEIIAEIIGPVIVHDRFDDQAKVEEMFRQRQLLGGVQIRERDRPTCPSAVAFRKMLRIRA